MIYALLATIIVIQLVSLLLAFFAATNTDCIIDMVCRLKEVKQNEKDRFNSAMRNSRAKRK